MMERSNVTILSCAFGQKVIKMGYHDKELDLNQSADKEEFHHPDLQKAVVDLSSNLADALWVNSTSRDKFVASGFTIDEKDSKTIITLYGKLENKHGYTIGKMNSGVIPFESERLIKKVDHLRDELFQYFFEGKHAQGTIPGMSKKEIEDGNVEPKAGEN